MSQTELRKKLAAFERILEKEESLSVRGAFEMAKRVHAGQRRQSGDEYIIHPLSIALRLQKKFSSPELTAAALLHDVVEDSEEIDAGQIYAQYGAEVGFLVDGVTEITPFFYRHPKIRFNDKIEKLLWGAMRDIRVILLKIADREHNLTDIDALIPPKQIKISFETQAIYNPLRKILKFDETDSIDEMRKNFQDFLEKERILDEKELKEFLFRECYENLSASTYGIVYGNSDKVIWTIEDMKFYQRISKSEQFQKHSEIISLRTNGKDFKATFYFKRGAIIEGIGGKFNLLAYKDVSK